MLVFEWSSCCPEACEYPEIPLSIVRLFGFCGVAPPTAVAGSLMYCFEGFWFTKFRSVFSGTLRAEGVRVYSIRCVE